MDDSIFDLLGPDPRFPKTAPCEVVSPQDKSDSDTEMESSGGECAPFPPVRRGPLELLMIAKLKTVEHLAEHYGMKRKFWLAT